MRHVRQMRIEVVEPREEALRPADVLGLAEQGERDVGEAVAGHAPIVVGHVRRHRGRVPDVEALLEPVLEREIAMTHAGEGARAGRVDALRDEHVRGIERRVVLEVAARLARVLADEQWPEALRRERRGRVRALEHDAAGRERVDVRRDWLRIPHVAEVEPQRVDGEEDHVVRAWRRSARGADRRRDGRGRRRTARRHRVTRPRPSRELPAQRRRARSRRRRRRRHECAPASSTATATALPRQSRRCTRRRRFRVRRRCPVERPSHGMARGAAVPRS